MDSERQRQGGPTSVAALVAAAGSGSRLGLGPKAFLELGGVTLLERAIAALAPVVQEIIVAVPDEVRSRDLRLPDVRLVPGGSSRQESVLALLEAATADLVLVHDVARPFLEPELAERIVAAAARSGAASAARRVADTLIKDDGTPVRRELVRAVQTPQAFERELLLQAHIEAKERGETATDDAALVRGIGRSVELVEGSPWLFKITTTEDLTFAAALASAWDGRQHPTREGTDED